MEEVKPVHLAAGFSLPIYDAVEGRLDLNQLLVKNAPATFFVRTTDGDILIVDRSLPAKKGSKVIAIENGEFKVKTIESKVCDFEVWGVINYVIHRTY